MFLKRGHAIFAEFHVHHHSLESRHILKPTGVLGRGEGVEREEREKKER